MRLLLVHRNFPGQFHRLLNALLQTGGHNIVFITAHGQPNLPPEPPPGLSIVTYATTPASNRTHAHAHDFDAAMRRAAAVFEVAAGLRSRGFQPDIIIGHEGWGETLDLQDQWPGAPQLGYREYFYHLEGADVGFDPEFPPNRSSLGGVRAKNAVAALALLAGHPGVSPTIWQRSLYPEWAQPAISLVPDAVDLEACRPLPGPRSTPFRLGPIALEAGDELVTFTSRNLEPYRGFHVLARALPRLLARTRLHVVCTGGDDVSYGLPPPSGTWRSRLLAEIGGRIDLARVHFPGIVPFDDHLRLLQRSNVHTYLSYPFIASWSLREALACGCTIVAGNTAPTREFILPGQTGLLVPPLDPAILAETVLALLEDRLRSAALGVAARSWAETHLTPVAHLAAWQSAIEAALQVKP